MYRGAAKLCRDGIRKVKRQLELDITKSAKNKEDFYKYIKRKVWEGMPLKVNNIGRLVTRDKKSEILNI